jgi:hypothetical protein
MTNVDSWVTSIEAGMISSSGNLRRAVGWMPERSC